MLSFFFDCAAGMCLTHELNNPVQAPSLLKLTSRRMAQQRWTMT